MKYSDYVVGDILFYDDNELNQTGMGLYNLKFYDVHCYFVELKQDNRKIVTQVTMDGVVSYFTRLN